VTLRNPLSFKPNNEEEEYLTKTGKINNWSETIHKWIEQDRKRSRKQVFDSARNNLILIFLGILVFSINYILVPLTVVNIVVVVILFIVSAVAITYGTISMIWDWMVLKNG